MAESIIHPEPIEKIRNTDYWWSNPNTEVYTYKFSIGSQAHKNITASNLNISDGTDFVPVGFLEYYSGSSSVYCIAANATTSASGVVLRLFNPTGSSVDNITCRVIYFWLPKCFVSDQRT